jgi:hypothetical protein
MIEPLRDGLHREVAGRRRENLRGGVRAAAGDQHTDAPDR